MKDTERKGLRLNAFQLKMIAAAAMVIDHIAWAFVPLNTAAGQLTHIIGRLTAPIMCYFLAEGFYYTKNLKGYLTRLGLFGLISAAAFGYFEWGGVFRFAGMGMIYTLFLGLTAITVWERTGWPEGVKRGAIFLLCLLSLIGDWPVMGVLWPWYFARYRGMPDRQFRSFAIVAAADVMFFLLSAWAESPALWWTQLCQAGVFLSIPLLRCYDGTLGGKKGMKWFFYFFYPAHLLVLGWLRGVL